MLVIRVYCVRSRLDLFGQPALPFTMLLDLRNQSEYMNIYAGVFSVETQLETPHGWRVDYGFHVVVTKRVSVFVGMVDCAHFHMVY